MIKNCLHCNKEHKNKKFCCNSCKNFYVWNNVEYRQHMSDIHKGKVPTNLEQLIKYQKSEIGRKATSIRMKGKAGNKSMLGKHHSKETKQKMSLIKKGKIPFNVQNGKMKGTNSPRWIFDRTKIKRQDRRDNVLYSEWRKKVWLRDNFTCKIANPDCKGRLEAHHILPWSKFQELRYQINNGITLCQYHHPRKMTDVEKLSPYFKFLVASLDQNR